MRTRETVLTFTLLGLIIIFSAVPTFAQNNIATNMSAQTNQNMSTNATGASNSTAEMAGVEDGSGQISQCKRCR